MEAPPRRQNRSCDRCRRSKRRCILESGRNQPCRNCVRLGDNCTFTLAASIAVKKRHRSSTDAGSYVVEQATPVDSDSNPVFTEALERTVSLSYDSSCPNFQASFDNIWSPPSLTSVPFCFENLFNELLDGPPGIENVFGPEETIHASTNFGNKLTTSPLAPRIDDNHTSHHLESPSGALTSRVSTNLPMALLTSTLDSATANEYLDKFFNALTTVLYHRYLSARANLSSRTTSYEILTDDPSDELFEPVSVSDLGPSAQQQVLASRRQSQPSEDVIKISVVGAARFLDNFALLYGNQRPRGQHKQDEETLHLVVRAIALNHSPTSAANEYQPEDRTELVADAWFRAYSSLVQSMSRRSFVLVYALFTFDLASTVPELLTAEHADIDTTSLLDHALRQLDRLSNLVQSFCSRLSNQSPYRRRLETCLRMMMWHGYVRDTVSSFRGRRTCILEDFPFKSSDPRTMIVPSYDNDFVTMDSEIPMTCERAFGQCFAAYRLIATIQTKSTVHQTPYTVSIGHDVASTIELVKNFEAIYHPWIRTCLDQFFQLSIQSQLSIGFLAIFWNLAILRFFDVIKCTRSTTFLDPADLELVTEYRRYSVATFATISNLIMNISEDNDLPVLDQAGIRLAFVAHHANSALMSFALETAIRHTIDVLVNAPGEQEADSKRTLKPLVWCLLSMERTNAGRTVARPAFHRLMEQYGDTILEFWTPEDDRMAFTTSSPKS